jgi:hypothetical protein
MILIKKNNLSKSDVISKTGRSIGVPRKEFKIDDDGMEKELIKVKNEQDKYYAIHRFARNVYLYDPFGAYKRTFKKKFNAQHVTNAFLKMFELLNIFELIPKNKKTFRHFDNAAFPGAFVIATNHYMRTKRKKVEYDWYASSWITEDSVRTGQPLEDKYKLYKKYPEKWLMSNSNDGNVLSVQNQMDWQNKLGNSVDLYTSDLGFATGFDGDYNKQEESHVLPNLGQALAGLLTLKKGGHLILKQYTFFNSLNISLYAILTNLFQEVYISKPVTSRSANSESYVICKAFLGPFADGSLGSDLINRIFKKLEKPDHIPMLTKKLLSKSFLNSIKESQKIFSHQQMHYVQDRHNWYNKIKYKKNIRKAGLNLLRNQHTKIQNAFTQHKLLKINKSDLL